MTIDPHHFAGLNFDTAIEQALTMMQNNHLPDLGRVHLQRIVRLMRICATMSYAPDDAQPVRLLLLRAEETLKRDDRRYLPATLAGDDMGWARYSDGPPTIHTLAGNHFSVLHDPAVRMLAACWEDLVANRP